ncbi:hypothetical protein [Desulfolutivibrio sp.]|uniref:hypothetical protein n=1 Tax=Desulfolutivibrio sp. TaxID=2773296 RepID=UPI002F968890
MIRASMFFWICILTSIFSNGHAIAEISVYDRSNTFLGYLVDIDKGYLVTIFEPNSKSFAVLAPTQYSDRFETKESRTLLFENTSCTGQAYIEDITAVPMVINFFGVFYRRTDDPIEEIHVRSRTKGPWSCVNYEDITAGYKAVKVSLPFRWEISGPLKISHDTNQSKTVVVVPLSNN